MLAVDREMNLSLKEIRTKENGRLGRLELLKNGF